MTTRSTTPWRTVQALCLLAVTTMMLGSCTKTLRPADITPQTGVPTITTQASSPVATGAVLDLKVTGTVSVASTLSLPELNYENQLGVCIFNGPLSYSEALKETCLKQESLPAGVALSAGSARDVSVVTSGTPGATKTFTHQTGLIFMTAGTYTVFGRQLVWTGSKENPLADSRRVTPQPLVVTVK